jgi:hypothetical protein
MWICTRGTKASPWSMPRPAMPRRFGPRQALPIPHTARRPDESLIDSGFGVSLLDTVLVHDPTAPGDRVLLEAGDPYRDACSTLQGFAMFLGVDRRSHGRLRRPGGFCPRLTGILDFPDSHSDDRRFWRVGHAIRDRNSALSVWIVSDRRLPGLTIRVKRPSSTFSVRSRFRVRSVAHVTLPNRKAACEGTGVVNCSGFSSNRIPGSMGYDHCTTAGR